MKSGIAKKKPIPVNFLYFDGTIESIVAWTDSFGDSAESNFNKIISDVEGGDESDYQISIKTREGHSYTLTPNQNVIVRGGKDEYWPIQKDIFEKTYDII